MVSHSSDQFDPAPQSSIPRLPVRTGLTFMLGCLFFLALLILPAYTAQGNSRIIYVDRDAGGAADGSSWADAYTDLQRALDAAVDGDEIWVAAGVYRPTERTDPVDLRSATFQLKSSVALYGGFNGSESARDARDWATNVTVLSGDLDDNDTTDPNGVVTDTNNIIGDNSYHVVMGSGTDSTTILDGFTVTAGNAHGDDFDTRVGGGMRNDNGSPTLTNVTFSGNAARRGGGMFNQSESQPTLTNVTFTNNSASFDGGGMYNRLSSNPILTNVTFTNNSANYDGGGMYTYTGQPILTNVTFTNNTAFAQGGGMANHTTRPILTDVTFNENLASSKGGGMRNYRSSSTLTNVTFSGNSTTFYGGGMFNLDNSNAILTNVTFKGNSSSLDGGGMLNHGSNLTLINVTISGNDAAEKGGGIVNAQSRVTIANSIVWGNRSNGRTDQAAQIDNTDSTITVSYSLVQGGVYTGTGNISEDPLFVTPIDPATAPTSTGNLRLQPDSPAIEAGNNGLVPPDSTDLDGDRDIDEPLVYDRDGNPRIVDYPHAESDGAVVDMGAYETQFVDLHLTKTVQPTDPVPGETVTYTLHFTNAGSLPAAAVRLTSSLPAALSGTTIAYSGTAPDRTGSDPYTWSLDELPAGTGGTIYFRGTLEEGLPAGTALTGTATISTTGAETDDSNNSAAAALTVANASPQAQDDAATTPQETAVTLPVLANDHDANHDPFAVSAAGTPGNGTVAIIEDGTRLRYTPAAGFHGTDRFTYTISDGSLTGQGEVTITVANPNDAPVADDATFSLPEDSADGATVGIVTTTDPNDDPLSFTIIDGNDAGVFAIDPDSGEIRVADGSRLDYETVPTYSLTVEVNDGELADTATITIDVLEAGGGTGERSGIFLPFLSRR